MILRTFVEEGRGLALRRRGEFLELVLGPGPEAAHARGLRVPKDVILLSSSALSTERELGCLVRDAKGPARVLVGGLGFGATLNGVLDVVGPDASVLVVEKLRAVIELARAESAHLVGGALDDPRVTLEHGDVADAIARERDLSAILLDVDNGPEWATFRGNARLYADSALATAKAALRPGGIFAVWSGYPADSFIARLRRAGFTARMVPLAERSVTRARAYVGTVPE